MHEERHPLSARTFTTVLLPPLLCYYATSILVLLPRTLPTRLALWPITLCVAFRASIQLDLAAGWPYQERLVHMNQALLLAMITLGMRASIWTFQQEPYLRYTPSSNISLDAADLCFNLRGVGWSWSKGLKVARESRNTASTSKFLLTTFIHFLLYVTLLDLAHFTLVSFAPHILGSATGASIFDPSLPPIYRYFRSSLITFIAGLFVYYAVQTGFLLNCILSVAVFRQSPALWPPIFDKPWFSTSLNQFWSERWHQLFRHTFINFGGRPLYFLVGRVGTVFGTFLASAILHWLGLWGMGRGSDFPRIGGFFFMMAVGTIMEQFFKALTGHRVGGFFGWAWSTLWVLAWGNMLVDAWCMKGLFGGMFFPPGYRPAVFLLRLLQRWLNHSLV